MLEDMDLVAFLLMSMMPSTSPSPLVKLISTLSATDRLQGEGDIRFELPDDPYRTTYHQYPSYKKERKKNIRHHRAIDAIGSNTTLGPVSLVGSCYQLWTLFPINASVSFQVESCPSNIKIHAKMPITREVEGREVDIHWHTAK